MAVPPLIKLAFLVNQSSLYVLSLRIVVQPIFEICGASIYFTAHWNY